MDAASRGFYHADYDDTITGIRIGQTDTFDDSNTFNHFTWDEIAGQELIIGGDNTAASSIVFDVRESDVESYRDVRFALVNNTARAIANARTTTDATSGAALSGFRPIKDLRYLVTIIVSDSGVVTPTIDIIENRGLTAVASDNTLAGTGTAGNRLSVANPYPGPPNAAQVSVDDSGFNGNLASGDNTAQKAFAKIDGLSISGGGGGLTSVASDDTLTGAGTSASQLSVANPFTADDETKLDGIAENATANTGNIISVTAGTGLTGGGTNAHVTLNVDNPFTAQDESKLDGIAENATANAGTITGVQAGTGLTGGANSGTATLSVAINPLNANNIALTGGVEIMIYNGIGVVKTTLTALKAWLGGGGNPGTHKRYVGFKPEADGANFIASDFKSATLSASSETDFVTNPTFSGNHYMAYAIPSSQPAITIWQQQGTQFNSVSNLFNVGTISLDGEDHVVYRFGSDADTPAVVFDSQSGVTYEIR